ncbi:MAG: site-2 protease family protein [Solirubrobacteraceae bacterium]
MPRSNVQLARVFGIRIGVEWSWFVVLFVVIYLLRGYFGQVLPNGSQAFAVAVISTLAFFASLVAHELGHALVARRLGLKIDGIDLWLFGGFTRTRGEITTPGAELQLAAAGPAVTALVTLVCVGAGLAFGSLKHLVDVALFESGVRVSAPLALFSWLALINLFLLVFNLLPAFPLDGGRITQAIAWQLTGDRNRATRACARIGQAFGWALIALAVLVSARVSLLDGVWLALIGFYLEQTARRAILQSRISDRIRDVRVADIMDTHPLTIPGATTLLDVEESYFLRHRWPWFAVVDETGHYVGLLRRERVTQELSGGRPALTAAEASDDAPPWKIDSSATLEALLRSEGLRALGAVIAVDSEGVLEGVVTLQAIRAALGAPAGV